MNATWLARWLTCLPLDAKDWLADLLALRWLVVLRRFWRFCGLNENYAVKINFPCAVTRKRYSRSLCSITTSCAVPNKSWLRM